MTVASNGRKILCVTSNFPRWEGDSTTPFILNLALDLADIGWQVDVLAPHAPNAAVKEVMQGISVERFRYLYPESSQTVCYQGGALINLDRNRWNYLKLPPLVFFEWLGILKRLLSRSYSLLHSHWILPQGFTGALAAMPTSVPHVLTVHGGDAFSLRGAVLEGFKRFALRNACAVTVNSSSTLSRVSQIAPNLENVRTIPVGISLHAPNKRRVEEIRSTNRSGSGPLLVFVGRLVEEKGVDDLIVAAGLIAEQLPDVRVLIVGDGQLRPELEALANRTGVARRIGFCGWVPPDEVSDYLAASDIFVGPSRRTADGREEGQGLTFLEAMSAGTPVIASDIGGIRDSVSHEVTGLLVPQNSPSSIADSVISLCHDQSMRSRLIRNAQQKAKQFGRPATAAAFSRLFSDCIGYPG